MARNVNRKNANQSKRRKVAFRKEKLNISLPIVVLTVIVVFCGFMKLKADALERTKSQLESEVATLQDKIESEEKRAEELKEFEVYTHTQKYAEEVAKDVLGYVYEDEIIFKPED